MMHAEFYQLSYRLSLHGDATFISTHNGPSLSAGCGMMNSRLVATECRSSIFSATFPGTWPLKPIVLPGAFGSKNRQLRKVKAKERGNPITVLRFRRHSRFKLILPLQFMLSIIVLFPEDEQWQHLSAVIGRCTAEHAHIIRF